MNLPVIIFGANSIGKAALDIFRANGVEVYGFLDKDKSLHGESIDEVPILGRPDDHGFLKLIGQKAGAFVATDDQAERKALVDMLVKERKAMPVNAIHASVVLGPDVVLHHGSLFSKGVQVGFGAQIGNHCILGQGANIGVGVTLGDQVQVGAGAVIADGVTVEDGAFIGTGAVIVGGLPIGKKARVGAGSVVIAAVENNETVFGNPAKPVKT